MKNCEKYKKTAPFLGHKLLCGLGSCPPDDVIFVIFEHGNAMFRRFRQGGRVGAASPEKNDWLMVRSGLRIYEYKFEKLWLFHQNGIQ